jgi:phage terminase large subunit-like protein
MDDLITDYALKVLDEDIPAGPYVIWACERHLADLERDDIWLDLVEVEKRVQFFPLLKHWKGRFAGKSFELSLWQIFRIGSVFGWRRRDTGLRRFTEAYTEIPRKNGKTTEAAGIGLSGMILDGEMGAEIYSVATKRDQAKIVWEDAKMMVQATPALSKRIKSYVANLNCPKMASKFEALGRDSKTLDGLNPYFVLYDEYHAYRDPYLRSVMQNALGGRDQPLEWIITTAGNDVETMCYKLRTHAIKVLDPEQPDFKDDTLFAYIACPFPEDDPGEVGTWARANPELGGAKSLDFIKRRYEKACQLPSEMNEFLSKQLNIWTSSVEGWLDLQSWLACGSEPIDRAALRGRKCYAGLDLAAVNDLSALCLLFTDQDPWQILMFFWCPGDDIAKRSKLDKVPYDLWERQGHITATPGNATDYNFIEHTIKELKDEFQIEELLYDRWQSHQMIQNLIANGVNCVGYGQGYKDQSPALKEIERRVISRALAHGNHPILRWNAGNAQIIRDPAGGIKLNKKDPRKRIDGIAAIANAVGGVLLNRPEEKKNPYSKERGMRSL